MKRKAIPEFPDGPLGRMLRHAKVDQMMARAMEHRGPAEWKPVSNLGGQSSRRGLALEPDLSNRLPLTFLIFFALGWNVFVGVFAGLALFVDDRPPGVILFLIPFVLAGLGLICLIVYQRMVQTNAQRVRLSLEDAQPTLGTVCRLRWRLNGRTSRIQNLTIAVEGRESATYSRGTDTVTDHETFFRQVLYGGQPREGQGTVTVSIPDNTMPSLKAARNAIEWLVTVHGEIPWWPDVKEEFPFTVHVPPKDPR
ncbi:MAG: hypothetical protein AAGN46_17105 [Acidobacteriota bacterium]